MAVPQPVQIVFNPSAPEQRYELWGNGRIDNYGGAPPVTGWQGWYDRWDLPVAVDIHITDWTEPAGYILDFQGGFIPFGGAPVITTTVDGATTNLNGLPYVDYRRYGSWSWDPSGSGQGYVVDLWGELLPFGGAPSPPRTGRRWPYPAVRAFAMNWTGTKRALTLDYSGGLHADFASVTISSAPYWPAMDVAWDLAITEWSATPKGYILDHNRRVWSVNGAPDAFGYPYTTSYLGRRFKVLSASNPLRLWQVDALGNQYEWTASTAPTATIVFPDSAEVTGTTRPTLGWAYSDPQRDSQAGWERFVFTEAFAASHTMTDPSVHAASAVVADSGIDPAARGGASPIDLPNGGYRLYVRASDSAGLWSAWVSHSWTQNVAVPTAPTGLSATANNTTFTVALSVTATTGGTADLVRFDASDDGGVTWAAVDGADAVPLATTTIATDRFPPLGVERTYRAVAYALDPRVASLPSATATATVTDRRHVLTARDDPTLGGRVRVMNSVSWTRPVVTGVFQGLGGSKGDEPKVPSDYATVVKDGRPKSRRATLRLRADDRAAWEMLEALIESASTLVHRDPFGEVVYCEVSGDWNREQIYSGALPEEDTPLRHFHDTDVPLVEVRPPHLAA